MEWRRQKQDGRNDSMKVVLGRALCAVAPRGKQRRKKASHFPSHAQGSMSIPLDSVGAAEGAQAATVAEVLEVLTGEDNPVAQAETVAEVLEELGGDDNPVAQAAKVAEILAHLGGDDRRRQPG